MKLEKVARWTEEAQRGLSQTLGSDREAIAADVNAGRSELWRVDDGASWMVTTVDANARELIVCCFQGRAIKRAADVLYRIAQSNGLVGVRFFTQRPGLARMFKAYPVKLLGYVYRCEVSPRVA